MRSNPFKKLALASVAALTMLTMGQAEAQQSTTFAFRNPNANSALLFAPSAQGQPGRTGYYNTFMGLVHRAELGFTDWISLTAGITGLIPATPYYISIKSTHEVIPMLRVGGTLTYNGQFGTESWLSATRHNGYGIAPGLVVGYGNEDYNVNVHTSYFIMGQGRVRTQNRFFNFDDSRVSGDYRYHNSWTISAVGQARATNNVSVIAEVNALHDRWIVLGGVRVFNASGKNTWDLGIAGSAWQTFPLPYFGYTVNF